MIKKYLDDIVLFAHKKNMEPYTDGFVKEWQIQLEDLGFIIDYQGRMTSSPKPILGYVLKIMNEYILLRCLFTHTANGFSPDNRNYCRNDWERKNISVKSQRECKLALNGISERLKNSLMK